MPKSDLRDRPIYPRKREFIEAHHRVRRARRQPLARGMDGLVNQRVRPHSTPLTHERDPGRTRTITAAYPLPDDLRRASKPSAAQLTCALIWPNSGEEV